MNYCTDVCHLLGITNNILERIQYINVYFNLIFSIIVPEFLFIFFFAKIKKQFKEIPNIHNIHNKKKILEWHPGQSILIIILNCKSLAF